jgi:hypothetical protein
VLPLGAQGQLIDAALLAEKAGYPINTLTTIRTEVLSKSGVGIFAGKHEADSTSQLLELMRKFHIKRGNPWYCIWSREVGETIGGHLHIGSHLSNNHHESYITQLPNWLGENHIDLKRHRPSEIGISEHRSWLVECCTRKDMSGPDIGAYLGKDEPTRTISAWGKDRDNNVKRVTKHKCLGGRVEGTTRTAYRHGTSRNIAPASPNNHTALEGFTSSERMIYDSRRLDWLPY